MARGKSSITVQQLCDRLWEIEHLTRSLRIYTYSLDPDAVLECDDDTYEALYRDGGGAGTTPPRSVGMIAVSVAKPRALTWPGVQTTFRARS